MAAAAAAAAAAANGDSKANKAGASAFPIGATTAAADAGSGSVKLGLVSFECVKWMHCYGRLSIDVKKFTFENAGVKLEIVVAPPCWVRGSVPNTNGKPDPNRVILSVFYGSNPMFDFVLEKLDKHTSSGSFIEGLLAVNQIEFGVAKE